jgi:PAS domain S-box-containing protein
MSEEGKQWGLNILHVDDEQDFLAMAKVFLERESENFNIDATTSAEEGMELLKRGNYDVVVSDYKMPMMDGLEFLQNLRQSGNTIPFIMLTGKGREDVAMDALNNGANHYLQKGGDIRSLFDKLTHVIKEEVKKRVGDKIAGIEEGKEIIMDSMPAMVFYADSNSNFQYVNKYLADVFGTDPEELKGKSTSVLFPEGGAEEAAGSEQTQTGLIREIRTPEGMRWVILDKKPLTDTVGNVKGVIGFAVDITEQKKAAEAAVRNEHDMTERYRDVAEVLLIIVDANQKIIGINRKGCEIFGYEKEEEVLGKSAFDTFCADKYRDEVLEVFGSLMRGDIDHVEYREDIVVDKSGEEKTISWHNSVLRDEEGKIYAILCSGEDVTRLKNAEEHIERMNRVLKAIRDGSLSSDVAKEIDKLI